VDTAEETDWVPPPYGKPGRILVRIGSENERKPGVYRWDAEVLDYDSDSGVFWINEGTGFDYWLDGCDFPGPGVYVIEGIKGTYIRGEWGFTDDEEEWEHGVIRPATPDEMTSETLSEA
jgi:hypothetical protein